MSQPRLDQVTRDEGFAATSDSISACQVCGSTLQAGGPNPFGDHLIGRTVCEVCGAHQVGGAG